MIGENLRKARQSHGLSLQQLSEKASVSVATLSRIETNKQPLDLTLFLLLAKLLDRDPRHLLETEETAKSGTDLLLQRVVSLDQSDRLKLWRDMTTAVRNKKPYGRRAEAKQLAMAVEELLAQIDLLRAEIESVKKRLRKTVPVS